MTTIKSRTGTLLITTALCLAAPWVMAQTFKAHPNRPEPPTAGHNLAQPMLAQCAPGFNKTKEHKNPASGALISFECTTPVIKCPKNPSFTQVSLEGKANANSNQNPDIAALTLRYTCTYYTPEG